jgi:hypothetical protein
MNIGAVGTVLVGSCRIMKVPFKIGDTEIHAIVHQHLVPFPTMMSLHDDEDTSAKAGMYSVERNGGRVIELVHSGAKFVKFKLQGRENEFDPNRIFSDAGIESTLRIQNSLTPEAIRAVKAFARAFLDAFALEREPVLIGLHNTVEGTVSVDNYSPDGEFGVETADYHVSTERSPFDFFYVTDQVFFDYLRDRNYNVVLQNNPPLTDDGTLSAHCSKLGIPCINIEAEMSHFEEQQKMILSVRQMIGR